MTWRTWIDTGTGEAMGVSPPGVGESGDWRRSLWSGALLVGTRCFDGSHPSSSGVGMKSVSARTQKCTTAHGSIDPIVCERKTQVS